ncbi:MAG: 50S ribosomal protein L24 [Christensenellaceae bacterium]|jgi:large subunit ribosomal protein L24|nr:50S ribosomal protein L24 [Christensenellaceae bacterium]
MIKTSVKVGDYVRVIAGKDKNKSAHVIGINRITGRALIEGKDLQTVITKAVKARRATDKSGLIEQPGSIHVSNIMPICSACNNATRIGYKIENGEKVRVCKKCGATLQTNRGSARKIERSARQAARKKDKEATNTDVDNVKEEVFDGKEER